MIAFPSNGVNESRVVPRSGGVEPTRTPFHSVLFPRADDLHQEGVRQAPDVFHDLSLDRIVQSVIAGREEYDLAPFFHVPLMDLDAIAYRQEVMLDLEDEATRHAVDAFAQAMRAMRERLVTASKVYYAREKQRWLLAAAEACTDAVERLARELETLDLASRGLLGFRAALSDHTRSEDFRTLATETRKVAADLASIRYGLLVRAGSIRVQRYADETDYSVAVEDTFRKFAEGMPTELRLDWERASGLNHVEAAVLDRVALLYPEAFAALAAFAERRAHVVAPFLAAFDREIHFYTAWLDHVGRLRGAGLPFCYPELSTERRGIGAVATFDMALADQLLRDGGAVVRNDFALHGAERVLVVTGANQGGKTTLARTFGQLHYLASLGCQVPGREVRLFLFDRLFTHFEREEDLASLRGKLEDDLIGIHAILERATPNSIVIMNEIFSSTTVEDASFLAREVMARVLRLDLYGVCVTFLDELTTMSEKTVSIVATVDARDPASRTFKLERRPANGLAYALALADKHRLTYQQLRERLRS